MTVLTPYAVAVAAKKAGWPQDKIWWVVATTFGETSWRTDAIGRGAAYGDSHDYYGLGQISDIHKDKFPNFFPPSENWKNPVTNLAAMYVIWQAQGDGAYSGRPGHSAMADSKTGEAKMAAAQVANNPYPTVQGNVNTEVGGLIPGTGPFALQVATSILGINPGGLTVGDPTLNIDENGNPTSSIGGVVGGVAGVTDFITNNLGSALWVAGGAILVILGLLLQFKSDLPIGRIAGMVAK